MAAIDNPELEGSDVPDQQEGKQCFFDPGVDRIFAVVLNLAAELWAQKEQSRLREVNDSRSGAEDADLKEFINRIFEPLRDT